MKVFHRNKRERGCKAGPSPQPSPRRGEGVRVAAFITALLLLIPTAHADKIRDLVQVAGVRSNQLVGYGLVVGLDGTGDQTTQAPFTTQSLENMLKQFGVSIPSTGIQPQLKD